MVCQHVSGRISSRKPEPIGDSKGKIPITFHFILTAFCHLFNPYVTPGCPNDRYITSDCDAVATVYEYQHYVNSPEDAVADVLKAGFAVQNLFSGKICICFSIKN